MTIEERLAGARDTHRQGNIDAAVPVYEAILAEAPDHPEALHLLGVARLQKGDPAGAAETIGRAVTLKTDDAKMHNNLGSALMTLGKAAEAAEAFRRAEELDAGFADAPYNLGNALRALKKYEESEGAYKRAIALNPDHADAHNNLGALQMGLSRFQESEDAYRTAYRLAPGSMQVLSNLVILLEHSNKLEDAEQLSKKLLETAPDMPTARYVKARLERRDGNFDEARKLIENLLVTERDPLMQVSALFELARILDAQKEYSAAFAAAQQAKAIRLSLPDAQKWDINRYRNRVSEIRATATADKIASGPSATQGPTDPVFFVGFPRSGTTLMEQILASHSSFVTTGEQTPLAIMTRKAESIIGRRLEVPVGITDLDDSEILALRDLFFDAARDVTGDDLSSKRLVDKMPLNIVNLGVVNRIFPDAKVIVALRDPRDTCVSCYLQFFQNNNAMISFMELENTGKTYAAVMDLWLRYREILTIPWHEYRYEDLTADFDKAVGGILEFLDVEWEDSVTRYMDTARSRGISTPSYAMVTQEISTKAVARWRNYEKELAPILPILEPFVKEFGYEPS